MHIEREDSVRVARGRANAHFIVLSLLPALAIICLPAGCNRHPPASAPHPPAVTVAKPVVQQVTDFLEYPCTLTGIETVDIRARVEGFLQSIEFKPRQMVQPNQLLFVIEPKQYKAQVEEAQADLTKAQADKKLADTTFLAEDELYKKRAEAKYSRDQAEAKAGVARGQVDQAQAALDVANINLSYTQVVSPIRGRVSRNLVDVGNLVGAGEKTLLTTVVNDSRVYAYFSLSSDDVLKVKRTHPHVTAAAKPPDYHDVPAYLGLADEKGCPHAGSLDFVETELDVSTSTLQLRAIFENPDSMLMPGLYGRIRVPMKTFDGMLLPDTAVLSDQGGKYVLRVNDQNVVEHVVVTVGKVYMGMRVIEGGLSANDRIVINGTQKARPGARVDPKLQVLPAVPMPSVQSASQPAGTQTRPGSQPRPASRMADDPPGDLMLESFGPPAERDAAAAASPIAYRPRSLTIQPAGGR
ncbi:MAG: efflux RND transporter periplasmic adaptor subunit [Planctomycetes bacterium]|nr:efflux RND transporter periplasmic adaptor subunit [Planctomycetota bacterium]